jgi:hypothetical protein
MNVCRDTSSASDDNLSLGGKNYRIELASWNDGVLNGYKYSFQFPACYFSVIIPCKKNNNFNGTAIEISQPAVSSSPVVPASAEPTQTSSNTTTGFQSSPNTYLTFFLDLDENKISGRMQLVGMVFDVLSGAVDGIGSLWCGLSGLVLGQCHQYDPENGYTKSQIGTPVVRSDGKVLAANAGMGDGILGTIINTVLPGNKDIPTELVYGTKYPPVPGAVYGRKKRDVATGGMTSRLILHHHEVSSDSICLS